MEVNDKTVLLTGATGFIGRSTRPRLEAAGWRVRTTGHRSGDGVDLRIPLEPESDWSEALAGASAVVHLAGRAHVLKERAGQPLSEFRRVNVEATIRLARTAARSGVRRFLFMSSIGVNGPMRSSPLRETDEPDPVTPYAVSKLEAELALTRIAGETGMDVTILRPPLTYGPYVGARFLQLLQLVRSNVPLPFGAVRNLRSFVGVNNLADAIALALFHPAAANKTFIVTDSEPVSTPDLLLSMGRALRKPAILIPVPVSILRAAGKVAGKADQIERLVGSLVADSTSIQQALGWAPGTSLANGLQETADWLLTR